jgi:hypothetical protein
MTNEDKNLKVKNKAKNSKLTFNKTKSQWTSKLISIPILRCTMNDKLKIMARKTGSVHQCSIHSVKWKGTR